MDLKNDFETGKPHLKKLDTTKHHFKVRGSEYSLSCTARERPHKIAYTHTHSRNVLTQHEISQMAARVSPARPAGNTAYFLYKWPPSLNADPSRCATLYTAGGVGGLFQRRSAIATLCRPPNH